MRTLIIRTFFLKKGEKSFSSNIQQNKIPVQQKTNIVYIPLYCLIIIWNRTDKSSIEALHYCGVIRDKKNIPRKVYTVYKHVK